MVAEFGHFALILALFVAAVQAIIPLVGAARNDIVWMRVDRPAALMQFLLVGISFGALVWLHVTSDFSVLNVVENSHTDKPLLYKITGVWGNHEGSMMLWAFILVLYGFAASLFGRSLPHGLRARALAVQGMIGFAFILFILLTSNPFVRIDPAPLNGNGLNPLLQDPGLALHPPFLYLGYVGFSMAFSFSVAALIEGRVDAAWARWVRPWTLAAWCALTLGIALGSWWSYYTLGWGGYWAWDPVENASLMPWLSGTALLHSCVVAEKRNTMKSWTILLSIVTFSLSLLGTFLVRSGVLTSVHSFASDPARGVFIISLLVSFTGGSLMLYAFRAPVLKGGGLFTAVSRESTLLFNNVVLSTAAGTVLIGTLYPLFVDAFRLGKISVGPPYFNTVMVPIMAPLVAVMAVGPLLSWKRGDLQEAAAKLKFALIATAVTILATLAVAGTGSRDLWAAVGLGFAAWLIAGSLTDLAGRVHLFRKPAADSFHRALHLPRSAYGMTFSHVGLGLVLIGIIGSLAWRTEYLQVMRPGDTASVAGYQVRFIGVDDNIQGPNYTASRAYFVATRAGHYVSDLHPERRMYNNPQQSLSTVAIHTNFLSDLYAVLGDPDSSGRGFAVHIFRNPLVPLIFFGAILMVLGGLASLTDRRYRIGAPLRRLANRRQTDRTRTAAVLPAESSLAHKPDKGWNAALPFFGFAALVGVLLWRLYLVEQGFAPSLVPSVMIGKPAPAFRLDPLLSGGSAVSSDGLKGKVTVVNFFASWCGPCREEHAVLSQVAKAGRLVGISYKDRPADARMWLAGLGNPYAEIGIDLHGTTGLDFGVYGVPETYVIDKYGIIRFKQTGPLTPEIVDKQLLPLLARLQK